MHPILFHIGSFVVHSYGVLIVLGFSVGLWYALRHCRLSLISEPEGSPRRIHPDRIFDIGFYGLLWGLVGARFFFVAIDTGDYIHHPLEAFAIWEGGLTIQGAMLFGVLFMVWYCKKHKLVTLAAADVVAMSFPLAYAIGRVGCLLNGCCYGAPTTLPWGVRFPDENNPSILTPPSQPIQVYDSIINLFLFAWLYKWQQKKRPDGELFWAYVAMYGVDRCLLEPLRIGGTSTYDIPSLHLTYTEIVSFLMFVAGVISVKWLRKHRPSYSYGELPPHLPDTSVPLTLVSTEPRVMVEEGRK